MTPILKTVFVERVKSVVTLSGNVETVMGMTVYHGTYIDGVVMKDVWLTKKEIEGGTFP